MKNYFAGRYREVPIFTIIAVIITLAYVFWPFDLIPDFIPIIGWLDDALVVYLCICLIRLDLEKYIRWKLTQERAGDLVIKAEDIQKSDEENSVETTENSYT